MKDSKIARSSLPSTCPSTATVPSTRSRPGTTTTSSPTKLRSASAESRAAAKKDHGNEYRSPNIGNGTVKNGRGKAAPYSVLSNVSSGATLPPNSAASGPRTSTPRVASAKETGTGSATGKRSASRLRPSSGLHRSTANSALKGMSPSSAANNHSNHSLVSNPATPITSRSSTEARANRNSVTIKQKRLSRNKYTDSGMDIHLLPEKDQSTDKKAKARKRAVSITYTNPLSKTMSQDIPEIVQEDTIGGDSMSSIADNNQIDSKQKKQDGIVSLLCPCNSKMNDDGLWIECTGCKIWYHRLCALLSIEELKLQDDPVKTWFCQSCTSLMEPRTTQVCSSEMAQCDVCMLYFKKRGLKSHKSKMHGSSSNHLSQNSELPSEDLGTLLAQFKQTVRVIRRIPKAARTALKLSSIIERCISTNDVPAWKDLLLFSFTCLRVPERNKSSLATLVKKNLNNPSLPTATFQKKNSTSLSRRVESKVAEGDISGAIKLLASSDVLAPCNLETYTVLATKHPAPSRPLEWPTFEEIQPSEFVLEDSVVLKALNSFPKGSAGGVDGLRPQILKDLCNHPGDSGKKLVCSLNKLCSHILNGHTPTEILPVLFGASLCALRKKDGGLRPIAVGNVIRRLASKLACRSVYETVGNFLRPHQLGFASRGGCEAAVHASREFLTCNVGSKKIMVKLDVRNAFNCLERDSFLKAVKEQTPDLFPYLYQSYHSSSHLFFGNYSIESQRGVQQGDPCGPLIFSLGIQSTVDTCQSELNVWYLDDGTLGGDPDTVLADLKMIQSSFKQLGLEINSSKCEIFFLGPLDGDVFSRFQEACPGIRLVDEDLELLGAPLVDSGVVRILEKKLEEIAVLSERISTLKSHVGYFLLRSCVFFPKLIYLLRTSPTYKFPETLDRLDSYFCRSLESVLNVSMDDQQWTIASLPTCLGGFGIRKTQDLALPAFLSSMESTSVLVKSCLNNSFDYSGSKIYVDARNAWNIINPGASPDVFGVQSFWDHLNLKRVISTLTFSSEVDRLKFLSFGRRESCAWLNAIPSYSLNTLLDNNSFRIAMALRLGSKICSPHLCVCGLKVEENGYHGLSCNKVAGRYSRHRRVNDLIKRALISTETPTCLEPCGLSREDGKRPDGMTLVPWSKGQSLVWDFTCSDTLAPSYKELLLKGGVGSVAEQGASKKKNKYKNIIEQGYLFVPFSVETLGPWCEDAVSFVNDVGAKINLISGDFRSKSYLIQRISLEIQRGNAACVMSTFPPSIPMDEIFYIL